jgi:RNA polymerase sigma-70 factor (ECF subfamily)
MFQPVVSSEISVVRARSRRSARIPALPALEEAFDARLLGEVARWDDQAAFESLYETHVAAVTQAALSICDDAGVAEDIAQQAFIALWVRAGRIVERSVRVRPWLCTVARNAALDHVRKEHVVLGALDDATATLSSEAGPEQSALNAEASVELRCALAALSSEERVAVEMVYLGQASYRATADAIGRPQRTIRTLVRRAIRKLRAHLTRAASEPRHRLRR